MGFNDEGIRHAYEIEIENLRIRKLKLTCYLGSDDAFFQNHESFVSFIHCKYYHAVLAMLSIHHLPTHS
jgi:hypothetical protein